MGRKKPGCFWSRLTAISSNRLPLRCCSTQHVEQAVAVFAAGHAHHDLVAVFDQAKVANGLGHLAHQALFELGGLSRSSWNVAPSHTVL